MLLDKRHRFIQTKKNINYFLVIILILFLVKLVIIIITISSSIHIGTKFITANAMFMTEPLLWMSSNPVIMIFCLCQNSGKKVHCVFRNYNTTTLPPHTHWHTHSSVLQNIPFISGVCLNVDLSQPSVAVKCVPLVDESLFFLSFHLSFILPRSVIYLSIYLSIHLSVF